MNIKKSNKIIDSLFIIIAFVMMLVTIHSERYVFSLAFCALGFILFYLNIGASDE